MSQPVLSEAAEIRRLKAEVKCLTEERDILKKAAAYFAKGVKGEVRFHARAREFRLCAICRALDAHRSGYYAWLRDGASLRDVKIKRLAGLIKHAWLASGTVYGYRKVTLELREAGEHYSCHRVRRLMKAEGLCA